MNNEEAALLLINHGANCDAQDDRNQTPLFFAAREGSYEVAKILLHHCNANIDLPDHMDCLPRDIAFQRRHMDIVKLLDECARVPAQCSAVYSIDQQAIALPAATNIVLPQASASKSRSKKCPTTQRKPSARSVNSSADSEDDNLLRASTTTFAESRPATQPLKKAKRRRASPAAGPSSHGAVLATDDQSVIRVPEQPPSYEHACSLRRHSEVAYKHLQSADINQNASYTAMPTSSSLVASSRMQSPQTEPLPITNIGWSNGSPSCDPSQTWIHTPASNSQVYWTDTCDRQMLCGWSPGSATQLSPADGSSQPVATAGRTGRRNQPLSPIHMQAMRQNQQQTALRGHCYHQQQDLQFQYPTPPSHYSAADTTSPPLAGFHNHLHQPLGGFPTPSPEASPGQWSSSPQSARSEWSEPSPQQRHFTANNLTNIKHEPEQALL